MKIGIYSNQVPKSQVTKRKLENELEKNHLQVDNRHPDIVVTLGGDGTILAAFHHYHDQLDHLRLTGVNTGHLGFYTDWKDNEIPALVQSLKYDNGQAIEYPVLKIKVHFQDPKKPIKIHYALNEATLQKVSSTMIADVYLGKTLFEHFRGEGLCIATPTGSTAYNKSVGGAVINSNLKLLQLTEVASINNMVYRTLGSPLIVGPNDQLTVAPYESSNFTLTVDTESFGRTGILYIEFMLADECVKFVKYRHINFWKRVQRAFIGEITK